MAIGATHVHAMNHFILIDLSPFFISNDLLLTGAMWHIKGHSVVVVAC